MVLLFMSLHHKMVIEIFCEIAYIRQLGCISSQRSGLRHLSCELQISNSTPPKTFFYNHFLKVIFLPQFYIYGFLDIHIFYTLYVTSFLIITLFLFDLSLLFRCRTLESIDANKTWLLTDIASESLHYIQVLFSPTMSKLIFPNSPQNDTMFLSLLNSQNLNITVINTCAFVFYIPKGSLRPNRMFPESAPLKHLGSHSFCSLQKLPNKTHHTQKISQNCFIFYLYSYRVITL